MTIRERLIWHWTFPALALAARTAMAAETMDARAMECDYGIILGAQGRAAEAESVFVSLLSHSPQDARALNNLGNLSLIRGQLAAALSFYDEATAADSSDAGIVLNEATALMLSGEQDAAQEAASRALSRAGGLAPAAGLLGIPAGELGPSVSKEQRRPSISKEEVLMLLRLAAGKVPHDSLSAQKTPVRLVRRPGSWRTAAARNDDANVETPALVYWKR